MTSSKKTLLHIQKLEDDLKECQSNLKKAWDIINTKNGEIADLKREVQVLQVDVKEGNKLCTEYRELKESFQHDRDELYDDNEKWREAYETLKSKQLTPERIAELMPQLTQVQAKAETGYVRQIKLFGKERADTVWQFYMLGYAKAQDNVTERLSGLIIMPQATKTDKG